MTSTPVPPKTAAGSVPQHIALYESLPSLIAQVRAGKIALGTTLQVSPIAHKIRTYIPEAHHDMRYPLRGTDSCD
jgi:hypothetical protein